MPSLEVSAARGRTPLNEDELKSLQGKAWHELGMIVFKPDEIKNWADRQYVINLAEKLFGKRRAA